MSNFKTKVRSKAEAQQRGKMMAYKNKAGWKEIYFPTLQRINYTTEGK